MQYAVCTHYAFAVHKLHSTPDRMRTAAAVARIRKQALLQPCFVADQCRGCRTACKRLLVVWVVAAHSTHHLRTYSLAICSCSICSHCWPPQEVACQKRLISRPHLQEKCSVALNVGKPPLQDCLNHTCSPAGDTSWLAWPSCGRPTGLKSRQNHCWPRSMSNMRHGTDVSGLPGRWYCKYYFAPVLHSLGSASCYKGKLIFQ